MLYSKKIISATLAKKSNACQGDLFCFLFPRSMNTRVGNYIIEPRNENCLNKNRSFSLQQTARLRIQILSQFYSHAQYVQAVCLADDTSCKHGGL